MEIHQWLDVLFGPGDDGYPFWLNVVRVNILLFLACVGFLAVRTVSAGRWRRALRPLTSPSQSAKLGAYTVFALTVLAAALRFVVARPNLMDFGGIPYSRLLFGYKGYFATAQFYSLLYGLTSRDIEHAILFDRIAGTLTIPLVYVLCRRLAPGTKLFPALAAFLFAVYPLHVLFSASDALAVFSIFLAAASYVLLAGNPATEDTRVATIRYLAGFSGLVLLTQARYENVLLLVPPALLLLTRRRALARGPLLVSLLLSGLFGLVYAYEAWTAGLSFRNPVDLQRGLDLTVHHLLLNPFLSLPVLFLGTLAIFIYERLWLGALALLPWICASLLCIGAAEDGHGTARIFTTWLILILPFAAYGFSLLCMTRLIVVRTVAAIAVLYFGLLPIATHHRLATQYLEVLENDRFNALLANLPPGVDKIVVPDDEIMWRRSHSTFEVYRKYQAILWGRPSEARRVQLIPLTDFLDSAEKERCQPNGCLFFFGLPCMEHLMFPETRAQCAELLRTQRTSVLDTTEAVAAPFVSCSVYVGTLAEQLCKPAILPHRFASYRIEG